MSNLDHKWFYIAIKVNLGNYIMIFMLVSYSLSGWCLQEMQHPSSNYVLSFATHLKCKINILIKYKVIFDEYALYSVCLVYIANSHQLEGTYLFNKPLGNFFSWLDTVRRIMYSYIIPAYFGFYYSALTGGKHGWI